MAKDKLALSISLGCADDGSGGQELDLEYSSMLLPTTQTNGATPLQLMLAAAKREQNNGIRTRPNPDYRPQALNQEDVGEPLITEELSEAQCLTLVLRTRLEQLLDSQISSMNNTAASEATNSAMTAIKNGISIV